MKYPQLCVTIILVVFSYLVYFSQLAFASPKVFNDNFNSDSNGSFPLGWKLGASSCPSQSQWMVNNGTVGVSINNIQCITNIYPDDSSWNNLGKNYTFDVDMTLVNGTDHNVVFRYNTITNDINEIHFQTPGDFDMNLPLDHYKTFVSGSYKNGNTYHIRVVINGLSLQVYINNVLVRDAVLTQELGDGRIGLRVGTGSDTSTTTYFDNVVVTSIDGISLPVPIFKQTDSQWKNDMYDGANNWFSTDPTINRWGCAMTSAAMVLKYYGINKLPDGTSLDPGSLNTWLKNNNGFDDEILSGYMIPNAITQLSKLARAINGTSFDMLETSIIPHMDTNQLTSDINNLHPDILGVLGNGHYIVADGISDNSFLINDPYFSKTLLSNYGNTFASMTRYTPAASDGSYIMAIGTNNISYDIKDENGKIIGTQFTQNPIIDPIDGHASSNPALNDFFPKPTSGKYSIVISDPGSLPQSYKLDLYLYDKDAKLVTRKIQGSVATGRQDTVQINFDHDTANNISADRIVTFDSMLQDIIEAQSLGTINKAAANTLTLYISKAKRDLAHDIRFVKLDLNVALLYLKIQNGHNISATGNAILTYDANYLISHL